MSIKILLALFFLSFTQLQAQSQYSINGFVKDSNTGEELIGATVYVPSLKLGATTNSYGFYSISLPEGNYEFNVQFIGYDRIKRTIELKENQSIDFNMTPSAQNLEEVIITGESQKDQNVRNTTTGIEKITAKEIQSIPALLGERDIMKVFQLTSGVKSGTEGSAGIFVRGGKTDQNLIILDEAPVYNSSHVGGLFSVFNPDAIKSATLSKGSFSSKHGGRLSSLLDIKMKEGNNQKFHAQGGVGLISSRLMVEGPIVKGESSYMVSGRRTYLDIVAKPFIEADKRDFQMYFFDLNAKVNSWIGSKDRVFLSGYFGRDIFSFKDEGGFDWGNKTATARWNHLFSKKLFSNLSFIYSKYDYRITSEDHKGWKSSLTGGVEDINAKLGFQYFLNPNISFNYGIDFIKHRFFPGDVSGDSGAFTDLKKDPINGYESGIYLSSNISIGSRIILEPGVRVSGFTLIGPFKSMDRVEGNNVLYKEFKDGEIIDEHYNPEPRVTATFMLSETSSLKAAYTRNIQFIHTLKSTSMNTPADLWYPSTLNISPSYSNQYVLGYYQNFKDNLLQFSAEAYYKNMENLKEFRPGTVVFASEIEPNIVEGDGYAYGLELSLKKISGKLTGWVNYTYSRVIQQFDDLNNGKEFPAFQDRPHDVNLVLMYKPSKRVELSALWTYQTGQPYTLPIQKYYSNEMVIPIYSELNKKRFKDYHRLDVAMTLHPKKTLSRRFKHSWTLSIYNLYGRKNTFIQGFAYKKDPDQYGRKYKYEKYSFFGIVPTITFNFKF
ncbi:MAG: TonB-dependent receptor domain-containing protein [Hyphomicrobiales bacterium]